MNGTSFEAPSASVTNTDDDKEDDKEDEMEEEEEEGELTDDPPTLVCFDLCLSFRTENTRYF